MQRSESPDEGMGDEEDDDEIGAGIEEQSINPNEGQMPMAPNQVVKGEFWCIGLNNQKQMYKLCITDKFIATNAVICKNEIAI